MAYDQDGVAEADESPGKPPKAKPPTRERLPTVVAEADPFGAVHDISSSAAPHVVAMLEGSPDEITSPMARAVRRAAGKVAAGEEAGDVVDGDWKYRFADDGSVKIVGAPDEYARAIGMVLRADDPKHAKAYTEIMKHKVKASTAEAEPPSIQDQEALAEESVRKGIESKGYPKVPETIDEAVSRTKPPKEATSSPSSPKSFGVADDLFETFGKLSEEGRARFLELIGKGGLAGQRPMK